MAFIVDCSEAHKTLKYISDKVGLAESALQQATDEKQIIAMVKNLLLSGSLVVCVHQKNVS